MTARSKGQRIKNRKIKAEKLKHRELKKLQKIVKGHSGVELMEVVGDVVDEKKVDEIKKVKTKELNINTVNYIINFFRKRQKK